MFFDQRLGPNDFTNRRPRRFPTADTGVLIEDARPNKFLDSVIMPRQWKNQDNVNIWGNNHGNIKGGEYASKWGFSGNVQIPTSLYPYSKQARKGKQHPQGKGW